MYILPTFISSLGLFAHFGAAWYTLQEDYGNTDSFFDKFNFFTAPDPTNGYVDYVSRGDASKAGLISTSSGSIYIGVDSKNISSQLGRQSVRLESTRKYTHGLVILDLAHMPGSICGTWPAFWMTGPNWPHDGEIDIIEGTNAQTANKMTLHTGDGCSIIPAGFSGALQTDNCYIEAAGQGANVGCGISSTSNSSYGDGFNRAGGGAYATEWTGYAINIWFFPRGDIPADIMAGQPNPLLWPLPSAKFSGACDIESHFRELQIIFDVTFCGDWAGAVWPTSSCARKASACETYVQNNPTAFNESYWRVNSLKVYQQESLLDGIDGILNPPVKPHIRSDANEPIRVPEFGRSTSTWKHRREQYRHGHKHGF